MLIDSKMFRQWKGDSSVLLVLSYLILLVEDQGTLDVRVTLNDICKDTRLSIMVVRNALKRLCEHKKIKSLTKKHHKKNKSYGTLNCTFLERYIVTSKTDEQIDNTNLTKKEHDSNKSEEKRKEKDKEEERSEESKNQENNSPTPLLKETKNKEDKREEEKKKEKRKEGSKKTIILLTESNGSSGRTDSDTDLPSAQNDAQKVDWIKLKAFFNEQMKNSSIPPISQLTDKRKGNVNARIREYGKKAVFTVIINASTSEFLNGHNAKNWVATFDWLFLPTNFPKVLEGNYNIKNNPSEFDITDVNNRKYLTNYERQELESIQRRQRTQRIINNIDSMADNPAPAPFDDCELNDGI